MDIQLYTTPTSFLFRREDKNKGDKDKDIGRANYHTLELLPEEDATEAEISDMEYFMGEYVPGELFKADHMPAPIVLGPTRDFTHEVTLHAVGNPDHRQYADIGPKKTVRVCGIEEAQQVVMDYQDRYDMGGGNCSKEHGTVWELKPGGKRKKVGEVYYNGRFQTVAEIKAWKAEMEAKYGTKA